MGFASDVWQLAPGQSYPISINEYKHAKFYFAQNLDHPDNFLDNFTINTAAKFVQ